MSIPEFIKKTIGELRNDAEPDGMMNVMLGAGDINNDGMPDMQLLRSSSVSLVGFMHPVRPVKRRSS